MNTPKTTPHEPKMGIFGSQFLRVTIVSAMMSLLPDSMQAIDSFYVVQKGDTPESILKNYKPGARIVHGKIKPGTIVKIYEPGPTPQTVQTERRPAPERPIVRAQPVPTIWKPAPKPQTQPKKPTPPTPTTPVWSRKVDPTRRITGETVIQPPVPVTEKPVVPERITRPKPPQAAPHTYPPSNR